FSRRVSIYETMTDSNSMAAARQNAAEAKNSTHPNNTDRSSESTATGLTQAEAKTLLAQYGFNEIAEEKDNPLLKFLSYFWGPIPWMIEAAALLSGVVRHWEDFTIITVLLLGNAVVGFWEEFQAG